MNFFLFIWTAIWCFDNGFRWHPKLAIGLFIVTLAATCDSQSLPMPPTTIPAIQASIKVKGNTNDYQIQRTNLYMSCSPVMNATGYDWFISPHGERFDGLPFSGKLVGSTATTNYVVPMTNATGVPGCCAVGPDGVRSSIRIASKP